jgi:hypothetical protein
MYGVFVEVAGIERWVPDIHDIMSGAGMPYFRADVSLLTGPLPWASLATILLIAFGLLIVASHITRRQNF